MAKYTIIADMGRYMVDLLRNHMVPVPIGSTDKISLFSPETYSELSLALYDIEILNRSFPERASLPVSLKYMLIINSGASAELKAESEHLILGKALSVLCGKPVIRSGSVVFTGGDLPAEISPLMLSLDERIKISDHICGAFRTSFFVSVSPVLIEYGAVFDAKRVLNG